LKTEFTGKYFNGITSKPYSCGICLGGSSLNIYVFDDAGDEIEALKWDVSQISKPDVDFSHKIRLRHDVFPPQIIEVEDEQFASTLQQFYPEHAFAKIDMVVVASGKWKLVAVAFLVLVGFGAFAFLVAVPNLAEYAATKVPLSVEKAIGESAYGQFTTVTGEDIAASALVQEFFDAIPLERAYDYTVTVLNSGVQNAFAVPGGRIAIYSGMLENMKTPEELAALLLHESAHVELQHSLKSLFRTLSSYFLISLLFGDAGGVSAVVFENIYVFKDLQYSREMEREADMMGLENMRQAGFNPEGMVDLFRSLEENSSTTVGKYELTEFMSTHPLTAHRIEYIRQYVAGDSLQYATLPSADSLFNRLKQMY
jgi:Zn-dependent protease with chaperone function